MGKCYQCDDQDLASVQAARREQIRAWADQQIADAEASRAQSETLEQEVDDWAILSEEVPPQPPVEAEDVDHREGDVLAATDEQEVPTIAFHENVAGKGVGEVDTDDEKPKAKRTSKTAANAK